MNEDENSFCVKCGLPTKQMLFNLIEAVPFCEFCYQEFLGKARGDMATMTEDVQTMLRGSQRGG